MRADVIAAGFAGATGVLIGAFGAHGMPDHLAGMGIDAATTARRLDQFDLGARYHQIHSVALLAIAGLQGIRMRPRRLVIGLMLVGILLFSGSLYLLVLTNTPRWGAVTPLGGIAWIIGWMILAIEGMKSTWPLVVDERSDA